MSARIVELDTSIHQKVQKLLPWAVLGKLKPVEKNMLDDHLASCAQCQIDLDWQRKLQSVQPEAAATPDMERALSALMPRLDAQSRPARSPNWMRWALAAQLVLIVGFGGELVRHQNQYRLLGASSVQGANLVIVFRPETSEHQLRTVLQDNAAHIVDGPTVANAYLLNVPSPKLKAALATLRAEPAVMLVEPLESGGVR